MKEIVISNGKILDCEDVYYMFAINKDEVYMPMEVLGDFPVGAYTYAKIIYKYDSGIYPGTLSALERSQKRYIIDSLVELKILEEISSGIHVGEYCRGKNYNN